MSHGGARAEETRVAPVRRCGRRLVLERIAAVVAVLSGGIVVGGLVALGACAAPFVFRLTPAPFAGDAMGSAFARFDQVAIGACAAMLGAEVLRTWLERRTPRALAPRIRRLSSVFLAATAAYIALVLTPTIQDLHRAGAQRGTGARGEQLDRVHRRAESLGGAEALLAVVAVTLHVVTLRPRRGEECDEEGEDAPAPLPPGEGG